MEVKTEIYEVPRPSAPVKRFDTTYAYKEMKAVVDKKLEKKTYETEEASKMSKELADEIRNKMRINLAARYKIFTVVSLFSQKGQGLRQCSRCYFDPETDYEVTYIYQNQDLICIATVYAVYYY
ncbi:Dynein_light chain [Hexamita inflata]|uniref:Dynein light chain n=1 Tax=Hexamita inflata TaxID=28002 RepID=A0AA86PKG4_9EUKA|nr:Dynein light chain [Hexamita inflata]CAI9939907.1 Dynein light chain [Hexamita inflata]CAI9961238.1 Dynein light chain [Hexamita inflata]CAI9963904.1 Dynein light chain [Hexamita inflata]